MEMSSSQITKDFNYGPDLGMVGFTTNNMRNKIIVEMFRRVVEESKLGMVLRPRLPKPEEPTCQASWNGEVVIFVKQVTVGRVRLPFCWKAVDLLQYYKISLG